MASVETTNLAGFILPNRSTLESLDGRSGSKLHFFTRLNKEGKWLPPGQTSVIYGANGVGKSSIGYALENKEGELQAIHMEGGVEKCNSLQLPLDNVYVFNDAYVMRNLSTSSNVESIVLLGQQVKIDEQIDEVKDKLSDESEQVNRVQNELQELESKKKSIWDSLFSKLKSEGGWAQRQQEIENLRVKKRTNDAFVEELVSKSESLPENFNYSTCFKEFDSELERLELIRDQSTEHWEMPVVENKFDQEAVLDLLATTVPAEIDHNDDIVAARVSGEKLSITGLKKLKEDLGDKRYSFCRTCFQELKTSHLDHVFSIIDSEIESLKQNSISETAQQYKVDPFPDYEYTALPSVGVVSSDALTRFKAALNMANNELSAINALIERKVENPRLSLDVNFREYNKSVTELKNSLEGIQKEVTTHNEGVREKKALEDRLTSRNRELAAFEIRNLAENYKQTAEKYKNKESEFEDLLEGVQAKERQLETLRSELRNESEAVEKINQLLAVVFGEGRLILEAEDGGYTTWSKGKKVEPRRLSTGEKNVLALCYFFVSLARGKSYEESKSCQRVIVLDDPVSSFDQDNKYGVLALLTRIAAENVSRDSGTRMIVLTHDLEVAYDLSKVFKDLVNEAGTIHNDFEYDGIELSHRDFGKVNAYQNLLTTAYKIAFEDEDPEALSSNDLRRL